MKFSKKFNKMAELYRLFAKEFSNMDVDFSNKAKEDMYNYETFGIGYVNERNGYFLGKKILNLQITSWKEDMQSGTLYFWELYEDNKYPHWWLNSVLKGINQQLWKNKNVNNAYNLYIGKIESKIGKNNGN